MSEIIQLFLSNQFFIDIMVMGILSSLKCDKRRFFWLRLIISLLCALPMSYWLPRWMSQIFSSAGSSIWLSGSGYIIQFLLMVAVLFCVFKYSFWHAVFIGATSYFTQHISFELSRIIGAEELINGGTAWKIGSHYIVLAVVYLIFYFWFVRKINYSALVNIKYRHVLPMLIGMLFACVFINLFAEKYQMSNIVFWSVDLICSLMGVAFQNSVFAISNLEDKNARMNEIIVQSAKQYDVFKQNVDSLNIKCHDLRYQIRSIRLEGRIDDAQLSEIESLVDNYDIALHTGNNALDVILTEKNMYCYSKKIRLTCTLDGERLSFINSYDLYALFGNAIENAIEAVEQLEVDEKKFISLAMRTNGNIIIIDVINFYDKELKIGKDGFPSTSKPNKNDHGYGMYSMGKIAQKYGGGISYNAENGEFHLSIMVSGEN